MPVVVLLGAGAALGVAGAVLLSRPPHAGGWHQSRWVGVAVLAAGSALAAAGVAGAVLVRQRLGGPQAR
ncbi:MAG: hypothetical protein ACRD0S_08170, partial [Acidimicrobiales bacterium]